MSSPGDDGVLPTPRDGDGEERCSIALCTYNGARFVREQLTSIAAAMPGDAELVLVDDASTDGTMDVAREVLDGWRGPTIVQINRTNVGSLRNFERALRMTTRPIVFLADQDDAWHPGKVTRMLDAFAIRPDLLLVHSDARIVDDDGKPFGYTLLDAIEATPAERAAIGRGDAFDAFIRRNLATGATVAIRRSLLDAALPIPDDWVHDEWLAVIAAAIGAVQLIDEPLIDYRQHASNQIGARRLALKTKVERAFNKPGDYYERQLRRATALLERLTALGARVPQDRLDKVHRKLAHLRVRAALPRSRVARTLPIAREWLSGGYRHYSTGMKSLVRDLFHRI